MKISFFKINQDVLIYFLIFLPNYSIGMDNYRLEANHCALNQYQRPIVHIDFAQEIAKYKVLNTFITIKAENDSCNSIDTQQNNPDYNDCTHEINSKFIARNYPMQFQVLFNPIAESLLADSRLSLLTPPKTEEYFIPPPRYQWRCLCKNPFKGITKKGMETHIHKHHKTEKFFTCPYLLNQEKPCSKKSISPARIVRHLSHKHGSFEICCNEIFDKKRYKEHVLEELSHY